MITYYTVCVETGYVLDITNYNYYTKEYFKKLFWNNVDMPWNSTWNKDKSDKEIWTKYICNYLTDLSKGVKTEIIVNTLTCVGCLPVHVEVQGCCFYRGWECFVSCSLWLNLVMVSSCCLFCGSDIYAADKQFYL